MNDPEYVLNIDGKYYSTLEIEGFTRMLKDPSYCYKFYWLEALVNLINANSIQATMGEIIDEMIANAWYSVVEYHIHLSGLVKGEVSDGLERAVVKLNEVSDLTSASSKSDVKDAIRKYDKELKQFKTQLTYMVPYRALAGFFDNHQAKVNWEKRSDLIDYIRYFHQCETKLPYIFGEGSSLDRLVKFDPDWINMINDNAVEILGWIQFEKLKWLQNFNPEVPGLVYKLKPGEGVRKLERVKALWNAVFSVASVRDIYTGIELDPKDYEIDHFVPWSFVMNDELWNLMPMESSLNSSKSNNLPEWNKFFGAFALNQYMLYSMVWEKEEIHKLFDKCYKYNLHSLWAQQELYREGNSFDMFNSILTKNMRPVYDSALRQGYGLWKSKD